MSEDHEPIDHPAWPLRPFLLATLGALFGIAFYGLIRGGPESFRYTHSAARWGAAAFVMSSGIVFAFSLERLRWAWSAAFAAVAGAVVGLVTWNNGGDNWGGGEGWQFFSSLLAVAIGVPLFQTLRDSGRRRLPYVQVHAYCWTNLVLGAAALAFVGAVFLLSWLVAALFQLIGLHFLEKLLMKEWFGWVLAGCSLGGAIGLLRDRDRVLGILQKVVTAVLSVLALPLAAGLISFVAALAFTGLAPLWGQTKATTPIVLAAAFAAFVLANAVIGTGAEDERRGRILRWAAAGLGAVMLPLALVGAVSTGKRIGQYGFTPERLWAMVFVAIALAAGLAYVAALILRRRGWDEAVRRTNVALAISVCGLALFLALPILSFGAISTSSQVHRLEAGRVTPDKFDWVALRFDFGPAGRRALDRLARTHPDPRVRALAARAMNAKEAWDARRDLEQAAEAQAPRNIRLAAGSAPASADLSDALFAPEAGERHSGACLGRKECILVWRAGADQAVVFADDCTEAQWRGRNWCGLNVTLLERKDGGWKPTELARSAANDPGADRAAALAGQVEVREVRARRLFLGGRESSELID
ncbi:MAG: hypothetical protein QOG84_1359 [Sphingomonadales bacterium]|jgi:hypothetical protein|nr:hypothetical protein [Sphingomonadales bacterium]